MPPLKILAAALLGAATCIPVASSAAPAAPQVQVDGLVVQVRGCHSEREYHYVPELGRSAWHYHRRSSCRPVEVPRAERDCHRHAERHYLRGYGHVVHRHVGSDCRVRILRQSDYYRPGTCIRIGPITFCD